jgi:hypothetical protein
MRAPAVWQVRAVLLISSTCKGNSVNSRRMKRVACTLSWRASFSVSQWMSAKRDERVEFFFSGGVKAEWY